MADISDVERALVSLIAWILYPNGTAQPSSVGVPVVVYAGWPQSSQLDADMASFATGGTGRLHVTVYPTPTEKNTTRYPMTYDSATPAITSLTLAVVGQQVTVGGTVSVPQNVGVMVNGLLYLYAVSATDTLATVASALAALVNGATASGATVTLPTGARITAARVGGTGSLSAMTKQQQRTLQVTVWADTPAHRSQTAAAIDSALSAQNFITLPDGTAGRMVYVGSHVDDMTQKANLYRRDLLYSIEYTTLNTVAATDVLTIDAALNLTMPGGTLQPIANTNT